MSDIVERLRYCGKELADHYSHAAIFDEAADEIERLRVLGDREQPVAWRCVADDGVSDLTEDKVTADQWRSDGFAVTPLYAAPRQTAMTSNVTKKINKARNAALEEAANVAISFLVGDPANGVPLRNPMAHEIADAIRALAKKEAT